MRSGGGTRRVTPLSSGRPRLAQRSRTAPPSIDVGLFVRAMKEFGISIEAAAAALADFRWKLSKAFELPAMIRRLDHLARPARKPRPRDGWRVHGSQRTLVRTSPVHRRRTRRRVDRRRR